MNTTMETKIVAQFAEKLDNRDGVVSAEPAKNDKGPYVEVVCEDRQAESAIYDEIDDIPCYVEVSVAR